jgi:hypothetical protein
MQALIALRWMLLVAALLFGLSMLLPIIYAPALYWRFPLESLMLLAPPLQWAGVAGMSRHFAARGVNAKLSVRVGYAAAIGWAVAIVGGMLGQAAGPGGLVYGFFVMFPGIAIGVLGQIGSLIGFALAEGRRAPT